jgi:hypothetical protein
VEYEVIGEIFEWRGPPPFYFVALPEGYAREIDEVKQELTYGWGMITCKIVIDGREYKTAITPKDGTYFVPLKDEIRKRHSLLVGGQVELTLLLGF